MKSNKKEKRKSDSKYLYKDIENLCVDNNKSKNKQRFNHIFFYSRKIQKISNSHKHEGMMKQEHGGMDLDKSCEQDCLDGSMDQSFSDQISQYLHAPASQSLNNLNMPSNYMSSLDSSKVIFKKRNVLTKNTPSISWKKKKSTQKHRIDCQEHSVSLLSDSIIHKGWLNRMDETDHKFSGFSNSCNNWKLCMTILSGSKLYFYTPQEISNSSYNVMYSYDLQNTSDSMEYKFSSSEFDLNVRSILYDTNNLQRFFFGVILTEFEGFIQDFEKDMNSIFFIENILVLCYRGSFIFNKDQDLHPNSNAHNIDLKKLWKLDVVYNVFDVNIVFNLLKNVNLVSSELFGEDLYLMTINNEEIIRRFILSKESAICFLKKYSLFQKLTKSVEFSILKNTALTEFNSMSISNDVQDILLNYDKTLKATTTRILLEIMLGINNTTTNFDIFELFSTLIGFWDSSETILGTIISIVSESLVDFSSSIEKMINIWCDKCYGMFQDSNIIDNIEKLIKNGIDPNNSILSQKLRNKIKNKELTLKSDLFDLIAIDFSIYKIYDNNLEFGLSVEAILEIPPEVFSRELYYFHQRFLNTWDPSLDLSLFFNKVSFNLIRNPLIFGHRHIHFITRLVLEQLLKTNDKMSSQLRANICAYWISVSICLKNFGDMAGWFSIIIALCSPSIIRLRETWTLVDLNLRNFVQNSASIMNDLHEFDFYMTDKTIYMPDTLISDKLSKIEISKQTIPYYGEILNYIENFISFYGSNNKLINIELFNDIFILVKKKLERWRCIVLANKSFICIGDENRSIILQELFKQLNCVRSNPQSIFSDVFFKKSLKCEPLKRSLSLQFDFSQNINTKSGICAFLIFNYIYNSCSLHDFMDLSEIYKDQNVYTDIETYSITEDSSLYNPLVQVSDLEKLNKHLKRSSFPFNRYSMLITDFDFDSKIRYKTVNLRDKSSLISKNSQDVFGENESLFYYVDGELVLRSIRNISEKKGSNCVKLSSKDNNILKVFENEKTCDNVNPLRTILSYQVIVKAGSLERLIDVLVLGIDDFSERLIHESKNIQLDLYMNTGDFRLIFFSIFRSFCAPFTLLEHFKKRLAGSKAIASRIGVNMKVSEYAKNNRMFPDWTSSDSSNYSLFNYDFYLKIHVGVLECVILWLTHYFDDFVDDLSMLDGFYSFLKLANDQLQNWKEIVSTKNELQYYMSQYLDLFENLRKLFAKLSYQPQIELSHVISIKILQEIDISSEYSDEDLFNLAYTLDRLTASIFKKLTLEDWIYCFELFQVQFRDLESFFEYHESISLQNDNYVLQDTYSLLSQIRGSQSHDLLINMFPHSIRELFRLRHNIIKWVISQITDINIDCCTRVNRILLYLRLLGVYKLTMTHLDFFSGPFDGNDLIKDKSMLPSFVGNAIAAALVRPESRLFIYAWSMVASARGLNGQVEDLASIIPLVTVKNSFSFTPCIGWIFQRMLKIVFCIPDVIGNSQLINFIKYTFLYDFILRVIGFGNHENFEVNQQTDKCDNTNDIIVNIRTHDLRTLEMVSENENYPLQFSNIRKPFESLIQKKIITIQKNQKHCGSIKKHLEGLNKDIKRENVNVSKICEEDHKKVALKHKGNNSFWSSHSSSMFMNNSTKDKVLALESEPLDVIDLVDSSVSTLKNSKHECVFRIKSRNGIKILLRAPSVDEYKIWYKKLKDLSAITFNKKKNILMKDTHAASVNIAVKIPSVGLDSTTCYGVDLETLCCREKSNIPKIVNDLIIEIEARGLQEVGIYRVPGSVSKVNSLKTLFDAGENVDFKDGRWADINIIAGALKLWLRELPEPLMTYKLYPKFIGLVDISDYHKRIILLKTLIRSLPFYNYFLVKRLVEHFEKIINYETVNQMYAHNLAIIFGPNFLQPFPSNYSFSQTVTHLGKAQEVIKELIIHRNSIFYDRNSSQMSFHLQSV
ncbi:hypothetical protein PNEG_02803 [Pneumocystis murina B123]|uniref:Rho-GAP domain-containing protein n=1 Tax=Pneumocystis murina (strain B123) TaxID=1069680 RepID=M7P576_PNEMU|nr:hypothetical protein PNEG_02803 [Pneumocystis murina B123]EMR09030.1 hypothetical protein PNEG_02803 [Pneumocystis murina B123]